MQTSKLQNGAPEWCYLGKISILEELQYPVVQSNPVQSSEYLYNPSTYGYEDCGSA